MSPAKTTHAEKLVFAKLRKSVEATAQAWAVNEAGVEAVGLPGPEPGGAGVAPLAAMGRPTVLGPVRKAGEMARPHLWGILNAVVLRPSNGPAEGINSRT